MVSYSGKFVDFFSGSGIMSYGFKKNGFSVVNAFELDRERCKIFNRNLSSSIEPTNLLTISSDEIKLKMNLNPGDVQVVTGCPPCQSFSSLHRTRGIPAREDHRTLLVEKYGTLALELSPRIIVFENVRGILTSQNREYFDNYLHMLQKRNYDTNWDVIDAADYGVPQHRKRVIAISVHKDLGIQADLPGATHSKGGNDGKKKWKTVENAISNLRHLESGESDPADPLHSSAMHMENTLKIIRAIPKNGGSRKALPPDLVLPCHRRLAKNKGAESVYGRMKWNEPSPTITRGSIRPSSGRFIHPDQDRGITLREMARLQTIPDSYKFEGGKESIASMIGDAVPFELAKTISSHVRHLLIEGGYV